VTRDRALEIIAVHGGDAARWPAIEAAALLALANSDAMVAAALADARGLDGLLADWAAAAVPAGIDLAAITRLPVEAPALAPARRWWAGGLVAAAIAAGIAFLAPVTPAADPMVETVSTQTAVQLATVAGDTFGSDADVFATVFTPTVDEDALI
jgi:hypothetical protein